MIVILCESHQDATDAYDEFIEFLEEYDPWSIRRRYNECLCVETDDDLRYIFIDTRLRKQFNPETTDYVAVEEFFDGLGERYDCCYVWLGGLVNA